MDRLYRAHRDRLSLCRFQVDRYRPRSAPLFHSSFRSGMDSICRIGWWERRFQEDRQQPPQYPSTPPRGPLAQVEASPFLSDKQNQWDKHQNQQPMDWQPRRRILQDRVERRGSRPPLPNRTLHRRDNTFPAHKRRDGASCRSGRDPRSVCHFGSRIRQGTEGWGLRGRVCYTPIREDKLRVRSFRSWDNNNLWDKKSTPPCRSGSYRSLVRMASA